MDYTIITSDNFKPAGWSGGTTTQLFIFPQTASYQERNFQFRLSSATVEVEKSDFTSLPGFSRKLMILAGEITISHEGHYSKQLNKFDVDAFEGDWKTSSVGRCTDFNLMTTGNTTGAISALVIEAGKQISCSIKESCGWFFIYLFSGKMSIEIDNKTTIISKGDLLIIEKPTIRNLEIKGIENSELVISEVTTVTK